MIGKIYLSVAENWKKYMRTAAELYSSLTCLKIKENGQQTDYIEIRNTNVCQSYIGKYIQHNVQNISLSPQCQSVQAALHELGHALGLLHTHKRHDRDNYITVPKEVQNDSEYNITDTSMNDNLGVPYDYGSVMHYGMHTPINKVYIEARDKNYEMTMNSPLDSFYDILMINKLYKCTEDCITYNTLCTNGGYPNPNSCDICICPRGFGGSDCSELPTDGVKHFLESKRETCFDETFDGVNVTGLEDTEYIFKVYWIKNNENKKITVSSKYLTTRPFSYADGCEYGGVEIKAREDKALTGYRFCGVQERFVTSNTSFVPVIVYHRKDVKLWYKFCALIIDEPAISNTATQPTTTTEQPTTTTEQPTSTTEQPISTTEQPTTTTEQPNITVEQPMSTTWQTPTTTKNTEPCRDVHGKFHFSGTVWEEYASMRHSPSTRDRFTTQWECKNGIARVLHCRDGDMLYFPGMENLPFYGRFFQCLEDSGWTETEI